MRRSFHPVSGKKMCARLPRRQHGYPNRPHHVLPVRQRERSGSNRNIRSGSPITGSRARDSDRASRFGTPQRFAWHTDEGDLLINEQRCHAQSQRGGRWYRGYQTCMILEN